MSDGERRLAAIMQTDVVGYTELSHEDESATLELLEEHRRLIRPILRSHGGREIKTMGDAFLVEFKSALDATLCAIAVQSALNDRRLARAETLSIRIGIHVGDVIGQKHDIYGDAVNIASRIEPLAEPGGVCISEQVYDQVKNKLPYPLIKNPRTELKGIRESIDVYAIALPWEKKRAKAEARFNPRRIAVLPFLNFSPDSSDEYFADGLTEELINRLSLLKGLEVIARTSVMGFKKKDMKASEIAKELKVGTLLEGSVRKAGTRVRVSAQLINANTEGHLWAENYDRELQDVFEVQSSVAEKVAGALMLNLLDEERKRVESTGNVEAYTLYLRAMQLLHEGTQTSCEEAIALLERAISEDPTFARAYAGLAQAWKMAILYTKVDSAICVSRAEPAARKALELGPETAEAHLAMAEIHEAMDRHDEERIELEKAIRINPNLAHAFRHLGTLHATFGRSDEAIEYLRKACSLDPLDPDSACMLIQVLRVTGSVDDALAVFEGLKEIHGRVPMIYGPAAMCYLQKQDFDKAFEAIDTGLRIDPDDYGLKVVRGMTYALMGRRGEAIEELRDLTVKMSETDRLGAEVLIRTSLGDLDEAFEALMRQAELHSWFQFKSDPLKERLWKDPRYSVFCKKVGIPT